MKGNTFTDQAWPATSDLSASSPGSWTRVTSSHRCKPPNRTNQCGNPLRLHNCRTNVKTQPFFFCDPAPANHTFRVGSKWLDEGDYRLLLQPRQTPKIVFDVSETFGF